MSDSETCPESSPQAEESCMSDPAVTAFLTQQLCLHGGRLPLSDIPKYVELSPEHIASIVREESRRFPQPEPGTVLAQSPVRLCSGYLKNTCQAEDCGRLHLCRHFILGKCFIRGNRHGQFCRFSHDHRCEVNRVVLKANEISSLREKELRVLLLLNDPSCMPEVCYDYSGRKNAAPCQKGDKCPRLHVCQHFAKGGCFYFSRCSRSHNLLEPNAARVMKERGFSEEMIQNIQLLRVHQCKEVEKEQPHNERFKGGKTGVKNASLLRTQWGVRSDLQEATNHFPFASRTTTMCMKTEPSDETRSPETTYGRRSGSPHPPTNKTVTTYPRAEPCSNTQQTDKVDDNNSAQLPSSTAKTVRTYARAEPCSTTQQMDKLNANNSVALPTTTTKTVSTYPKAVSTTAPQQLDKANAEISESPLSTCFETTLTNLPAAQKSQTLRELEKFLPPVSPRSITLSSSETVQPTPIHGDNTFIKQPSPPLITELDTAHHSTTSYPKTKAANHLDALSAAITKGAVQQTNQPTVRTSINAAASPTGMNNLQSHAPTSPPHDSAQVQASHLLSQTPVSTMQTLIPGTVTSTVSKASVNASDIRNVHYSVGRSPALPATVRKADFGVAPGTKQARVPSNAAIYEINPFEEFSLPGPAQNVVRVYVHKDPPPPEDRGDPNEICFYHVWKFCEKKDKCGQMHYHLPYRWQISKASGNWDDLPWMEDIEKAYSDPNNTRSDKHDINFGTMVSSFHRVRRLSTPSSVTQPVEHLMTTEWVWHWKNEDGKWIEYGKHGGKEKSNIASADLESIYLSDKESTVPFQAGSQRYEINFKDMIQKNVHYKTQKEVCRRPRFVSKDDVDILKGSVRTSLMARQPSSPGYGFPAYWDTTALPDPGYKLVEISKSSAEFKEIAQSFGSTMQKHSIAKLQRIQNVTLWRFYQLQKEVIKKRNKMDVLEKKLFHGTNLTHVPAICNSNFDWRICGLNGTVYGRGSYFARDAFYSHNYCQPNSGKTTMFLARVLVGDFVSGHQSYALPPLKPYSKDSHYDSCVDNEADPSIYVVFEKNQIYPEYLLEYDANSSCCLS